MKYLDATSYSRQTRPITEEEPHVTTVANAGRKAACEKRNGDWRGQQNPDERHQEQPR